MSLPVHIALVPDGNRRWAKKKGLVATAGHVHSGSYDSLRSLFRQAQSQGVQVMTIWAFSTENWKRSKKEIDTLFSIIERDVEQFIKNADIEKVAFRCIGRRDRIPPKLVSRIEHLENITSNYKTFTVVVALDYGGQDEVERASEKARKTGKSFVECLDTFGLPNPDLIIRTGGEQRLSGFMPYQSVYSELLFSEVLFPEFTADDLKDAIRIFGERERRVGK